MDATPTWAERGCEGDHFPVSGIPSSVITPQWGIWRAILQRGYKGASRADKGAYFRFIANFVFILNFISKRIEVFLNNLVSSIY